MEPIDWLLEERVAWTDGYRCIAGIDEAGRGALAGPVVAACVVLPYEIVPPGVNDSKALTPAQREVLYARILQLARGVGVGAVGAARIDEINILRAAHEAMRLALADLPAGLRPDMALIDGLPVVPFPIDQTAITHGDARSASIAAASIIAKVTRDRLMCVMDAEYSDYGFAVHKGYPSPAHLRALTECGPCAEHRRTYRPVAERLPGNAPTKPPPKSSRTLRRKRDRP